MQRLGLRKAKASASRMRVWPLAACIRLQRDELRVSFGSSLRYARRERYLALPRLPSLLIRHCQSFERKYTVWYAGFLNVTVRSVGRKFWA